MPNDNSIGGFRYCMLFVDEFSDKVFVYPTKRKSEFFTCFKHLCTELQAHAQGKTNEYMDQGPGISQLRTDGEQVLNSKVVAAFCKELGIVHEHQTPYDSE